MSQELEIFEDFLKHKKLRLTPQRKTVLQVFLQTKGHINMEELREQIKEVDDKIGISTVYRTLNLLVECGLTNENIFSKNKRYFEKKFGREHHDHLICTKCGKIEEFFHPLIESFQEEIASLHYFSITSHRMTLFGICKVCSKTV